MIGRLLLVAGSLIVVLGVAEVGLRLAGIGYPNFYTWSEVTGGALRPGAEGWWRGEGETYIRINSDGLRDREHTKAKPPGTFRIAVLGDSYAEAFQVPIEQTFWSVAAGELTACAGLGGRPVEVINFGVSGYGTTQQLMTLRHKVWAFAPDVVLLAFYAGNDIKDNSWALDGDPMRPYYAYQGDQLTLDVSFRDTAGFRARVSPPGRLYAALRDESRVMQLIYRALAAMRGAGQHDLEGGIKRGVFSEPADALWRDAWRITEGVLALMHDEVRAGGADFLVATVSTGFQVHPDRAVRESHRQRLGVDDLFYAGRRIAALGDREGFAVLALPPLLQARTSSEWLHGGDDNPGFGHWNAAGHRLAGHLIGQRLCSQISATAG